MPPIDREGIFRAKVTDIGFRPPKEGVKTRMVAMKFVATEMLVDTEWKDWSEYGAEVYGDVCLIKKDGTIHERGVETLRDALGWDGSAASIENGTFEPWACQIVVAYDEYDGKTRLKVQWINHFNSEGGSGMKKATPNDTKGFDAQHGAAMRAICTKATTKAPAAGDDIPF
jgi:hypothetical protein